MMRLTIERLRAGVVAGAVVLLLGLGTVFVVAHHRAYQLLRDLPSRLGADISKQSNGVTYSQTVRGRTVFTVHAARGTQRKNGEALLEDAGLVLYGDGDGRADRIYGKSFDYNQATGEVHALGEVQLDLHAVAPVSAADRLAFASGAPIAPAAQSSRAAAAEPVHVTTSDLLYAQKRGMASTAAPVHFEYDGVVGDARGATYNTQTGFTTFDHAVEVRGNEGGRAFRLTADYAELDRASNRLNLRQARLDREPGSRTEQRVSAAQMVLLLAPAGGVDRVQGFGGVELAADLGTAHSATAELVFAGANRPQKLAMHGGVQFARGADAAEAQLSGSAVEAIGHFDASGALSTLDLEGDVHVLSTASGGSGRRRLTGNEVVLALSAAKDGRRWLRDATATGAAALESDGTGRGGASERLTADRIEAQLHLFAENAAELEHATATGHASLRQSTEAAVTTSEAPSIEARFAAGPRGHGAASQAQLVSAVERGGVVIDRTTRASGAAASVTTHATALEATYDAATRQETLSGSAVIAEPGRVLRADRVVTADASGDAEATGNVQATLNNGAGAKAQGAATGAPTHAVAARAVMNRSTDTLSFFGSSERGARLWQGASQIEAAVVTLVQHDGTLDAHGTAGAAATAGDVRTVLAQEQTTSAEREGVGAGVARVESARVHYAEGGRRAEFSGGVVLHSREGTLHADRAVATLAAAAGRDGGHTAPAAASGAFGGELERVVAGGGVLLEQPGRTATGEQIVYTAADGLFVLTGTAARAPRVVDQANGSVTGAVLRFHTGDNSVAVEGSAPPGKGGRVHTETRLKQ